MNMEENRIQAEIATHKKYLAKRFVSSMNEEFVNEVKAFKFQVPPRIEGKVSCRVSTHSTTDSLDQESSQRSQDQSWTAVHDGSKRVHKITEALLQFEERCYIDRVIGEEQLRALRSLNRGVLGKVIEHFSLFKHQRSLPIAINILMFNSSKMKIPKDSFKDLISDLFPRADAKDFTIHSIRQSKTYSVLRSIIKAQF